jgi:hypothetical protein
VSASARIATNLRGGALTCTRRRSEGGQRAATAGSEWRSEAETAMTNHRKGGPGNQQALTRPRSQMEGRTGRLADVETCDSDNGPLQKGAGKANGAAVRLDGRGARSRRKAGARWGKLMWWARVELQGQCEFCSVRTSSRTGATPIWKQSSHGLSMTLKTSRTRRLIHCFTYLRVTSRGISCHLTSGSSWGRSDVADGVSSALPSVAGADRARV